MARTITVHGRAVTLHLIRSPYPFYPRTYRVECDGAALGEVAYVTKAPGYYEGYWRITDDSHKRRYTHQDEAARALAEEQQPAVALPHSDEAASVERR